MSIRRGWVAAILVPFLLVSTTACTGGDAGGASTFETCALAETVATTPADKPEALAEAMTALAEELPTELQTAALSLLPAGQTTGDDFAAQHKAHLRALVDLQSWALDTCRFYLTIGAPTVDDLTPEEASLADFQSVVGEDETGIYVSVLGVRRDDIALALCQQALAQQLAVQRGEDAEVHVQVLDPIGQAIAYSDETECVSASP